MRCGILRIPPSWIRIPSVWQIITVSTMRMSWSFSICPKVTQSMMPHWISSRRSVPGRKWMSSVPAMSSVWRTLRNYFMPDVKKQFSTMRKRVILRLPKRSLWNSVRTRFWSLTTTRPFWNYIRRRLRNISLPWSWWTLIRSGRLRPFFPFRFSCRSIRWHWINCWRFLLMRMSVVSPAIR